MNKRIFILIQLILSCFLVYPQAGQGVYQFLDLPVSSRMAALGSANVSLADNDINFAFQNPSLLSAETHNMIGLNMANYLADIRFGTAMYGRTFGDKNYMAFGIQYVDFGLFKGYNEFNEPQPDFFAKDFALSIMYARPLTEKISVGATLKPVYSVYEFYTSIGLAMDAGASYNDKDNLFSAGLVFRNMGTQFKGYYSEDGQQHYESLPFNIQLGLSKKLKHAPLRFSATFHNLQRWNLTYRSTNQSTGSLSPTDSDSDIEEMDFIDMAFRHTIFGVEFVPSKSFYLAMGYNHRRHQEMRMGGFKSMAGFSFGGGIKLSKFHVGFGMTQFQVGNYSYQFSISTSLNEFKL